MLNMLGVKDLKGPITDLLEKLGSSEGEEWFRDFKKFLRKENPFVAGLDYSSILADWQGFYKEVFGMILDFSNVSIPERPTEGKWRLLIITDITITLETLYTKCKEKFPCRRWTNDNLDKIVVYNERDGKSGPYVIWVRDEVEADENFKNKSANDIKATGIKTETLAERLIHELKFFQGTGGSHLDVKSVTLCSGSRYTDGVVPSVCWRDGEMRVFWHFPDYTSDYLRSRQAVS